eukprot:scaffold216170_cov30-Tisochrysis_lutea.AAC.2
MTWLACSHKPLSERASERARETGSEGARKWRSDRTREREIEAGTRGRKEGELRLARSGRPAAVARRLGSFGTTRTPGAQGAHRV